MYTTHFDKPNMLCIDNHIHIVFCGNPYMGVLKKGGALSARKRTYKGFNPHSNRAPSKFEPQSRTGNSPLWLVQANRPHEVAKHQQKNIAFSNFLGCVF